jgi:hypothetical protein
VEREGKKIFEHSTKVKKMLIWAYMKIKGIRRPRFAYNWESNSHSCGVTGDNWKYENIDPKPNKEPSI